MERIEIPDYLKSVVEKYFADNAKQLYNMVDKILFKLRFTNVDKNDFYSLANEVFMYVIRDYDSSKSFDGFLYSCLYKKICTEMTNRRRDKRCTKITIEEKNEKGEVVEKTVVLPDISLYTPIGDDENSSIGDLIADEKTIEKELFEEKKEWKKEVNEYLNSLSPLQRKIAFLLSDNNTPSEICEELHITIKHFENSMKRILADERIKPLRPLVERM